MKPIEYVILTCLLVIILFLPLFFLLSTLPIFNETGIGLEGFGEIFVLFQVSAVTSLVLSAVVLKVLSKFINERNKVYKLSWKHLLIVALVLGLLLFKVFNR